MNHVIPPTFIPPPEAPVFSPTMDEFQDSQAYIEKIRPIAEQYGICKIKPPAGWNPPFSVDEEKLKFTPRIQRLNELEAHTRIKLNFMNRLEKFWDQQGSMLKIPTVERRPLDLYTLRKVVSREGGWEKVSSVGGWAKVARKLGFNPSSSTKTGNRLKSHYETILSPMDVSEKEEPGQPMEAFGFYRSQTEFSLQSFGAKADQFKKDHFKMPLDQITTEQVEREYWRLLESMEEYVEVEYGADLHTKDYGSGFPINSKNLSQTDRIYAESEWNLNNIPVVENSLLKHVDVDISGMKVPWLYVGMCFSTFCWHVEDHWTPSINFLHFGEPKTWYGIPSNYAEKAEAVMRESAKELFQFQPDLLHDITTTMNPNVLQSHGVPVFRVDQNAGEFIITFPRGYHAGFNHGYNVAEAVNFAPPDWLELGRLCVEHYSSVKRFCVFSQDELVCKVAANPGSLSQETAELCHWDMEAMFNTELASREMLLEAGVTEMQRETFEDLSEDERLCAHCKTTCFLSALTTKDSDKIYCLRHFQEMDADPSTVILRHRFTLEEILDLMQGLKIRIRKETKRKNQEISKRGETSVKKLKF